MQLYPYKNVTYTSSLNEQKIRESIEQNIGMDGSSEEASRLFIGRAKGLGYLIKNNIFYQNSFLPYCHITLNEAGALNKSVLTIKYRMNYWVLAFMVVFMGHFLVIGIETYFRSYKLTGLIPLLIFFVSYGIVTWGFNKELKKSEARLINTLSLVPKYD